MTYTPEFKCVNENPDNGLGHETAFMDFNKISMFEYSINFNDGKAVWCRYQWIIDGVALSRTCDHPEDMIDDRFDWQLFYAIKNHMERRI